MADEKIEAMMDAGLTLNEAKVYIALIELNMSNVVKIAELSGVHRVNVYDSLDKLKKKGLVNTVDVDSKKQFQAIDPKVLTSLMDEKTSRINKILPQLELIRDMKKMETQVGIYEGTKAMRNLYNSYLDMGEERIVFGGPKEVSNIFSDFLKSYHEKRVAMKKRMKVIYNNEAKERVKKLNKLAYTEAKVFGEEYNSPVSTSICGDQVVHALWSDNPRFIVIVDKKIAGAYRNYFNILWEKAKKP